jgi:peroxiredoxin Q/BCP
MPNNPIKVGDALPDFTLLDQNNQPVNTTDFLGQPLVIFFYPKDHTPGCIAQACDFRNYESEFQAANAQVIGINDADVASHRGFAEKYNLTYPILSDPGHKVRKSLGASGLLFNTVANRITYVMDENHRVVYIFKSLLRATDHVEESLVFLKSVVK